ncbi:MAG: hypothetical protein V4724_27730 [Pseudomonadota bacterium]
MNRMKMAAGLPGYFKAGGGSENQKRIKVTENKNGAEAPFHV